MSQPVRSPHASRLAPAALIDEPHSAVVIDEWPLVRAGVAEVLRGLGLDVVASSALGADASRAGTAPALVILGAHADQPMADTARSVKRLQPAPRVIVLVERTDAEELRGLLDLGVEGVLVRAVAQDDLAAAVRRVLHGDRVVSGGPLSVLAGALQITAAQTGTTPLTAKERAVLAQLAHDASNREIARALHLSEATVKTHLSNLYAKLGVEGRRQAVAEAFARGLLR